MMQSHRACPCLITLIKHPVRWNDLAPHNPPNTLRIPHHLPIPPFLLFCRSMSVEVQQRPSPVGTGLCFTADCEAQSRFSLFGTCSALKLQWFLTCSLRRRSCQSLPSSLTCCRRRKTEMKAIPFWLTLLRIKNHFSPSLLPCCLRTDLSDSGRPRMFLRTYIDSTCMNLSLEGDFLGPCWGLRHLALVGFSALRAS